MLSSEIELCFSRKYIIGRLLYAVKENPPIINRLAPVFTGAVFAELLTAYDIKSRLGAIGKHGSIAVTERVNKTLKYEWLKRIALIKGIDHLTCLCKEFEIWYNRWRPHMTLDGIRPDVCIATVSQRSSNVTPKQFHIILLQTVKVRGAC